METSVVSSHPVKSRENKNSHIASQHYGSKPNQVGSVILYGIPIVSLIIDTQERLCLAQISNTLLKQFSYNEIHNRRVALGITCVQCTPVQLEILRRAGAMPVSSRRCGMITRREAERLCKSFLGDNAPPRLPDDFAFSVHHECAWGCRGAFLPSRYNSSRAKCIKCSFCGLFFSPNKFIFHSHRMGPGDKYVQPDAANFNSWRRHMKLSGNPPDEIVHAWEDVKAMFNGGTRKRLMGSSSSGNENATSPSSPKQPKLNSESPIPAPSIINFPVSSPSPALTVPTPRVPPFPEISLPLSRSLVMDYVWHQSQAAKQHHQFPFSPYSLPWLKRGSPLFFGHNPSDSSLLSFHRNSSSVHDTKPIFHQSAFRPVQGSGIVETSVGLRPSQELSDDETVDIETTEDEDVTICARVSTPKQGWTSPKHSQSDRLNETSSPISVQSITAVHSSPSPIALKMETGVSPPPMVNHLLSDDNNLPERYSSLSPHNDITVGSSITNEINYLKHVECHDRIGMIERSDIRSYPRDSLCLQDRLDYPRDSLWSVARLTLERFERGPDIYRPDSSGPVRSFADNTRDRRSESPKSNNIGKSSDCSSCLACRPDPMQPSVMNLQTTLTATGENNNKISAP